MPTIVDHYVWTSLSVVKCKHRAFPPKDIERHTIERFPPRKTKKAYIQHETKLDNSTESVSEKNYTCYTTMVSQLHSGARILENATIILNSSIESLNSATKDTERIKKILRTERVFGLVPEKDVVSATTCLEADAHPQIRYLLTKVEQEVGKLRRKNSLLQSKHRLQMAQQSTSNNVQRKTNHQADPFKIGQLKFLQQKRKRLAKSLVEGNQARNTNALVKGPALAPSSS